MDGMKTSMTYGFKAAQLKTARTWIVCDLYEVLLVGRCERVRAVTILASAASLCSECIDGFGELRVALSSTAQ